MAGRGGRGTSRSGVATSRELGARREAAWRLAFVEVAKVLPSGQ